MNFPNEFKDIVINYNNKKHKPLLINHAIINFHNKAVETEYLMQCAMVINEHLNRARVFNIC